MNGEEESGEGEVEGCWEVRAREEDFVAAPCEAEFGSIFGKKAKVDDVLLAIPETHSFLPATGADV